jgi:hypothetical protein
VRELLLPRLSGGPAWPAARMLVWAHCECCEIWTIGRHRPMKCMNCCCRDCRMGLHEFQPGCSYGPIVCIVRFGRLAGIGLLYTWTAAAETPGWACMICSQNARMHLCMKSLQRSTSLTLRTIIHTHLQLSSHNHYLTQKYTK